MLSGASRCEAGFQLRPPRKARGRSAARRSPSCPPRPPSPARLRRGQAAARLSTRPPSGAPFVAFSGSRVRTSGHGQGARPTIRAAHAALRPCRVQPLKAAGRSAGGRRSGAPGSGLRARPQAPPLLPFQQRPAGTPLGGEGERNISLEEWNVKRVDRRTTARPLSALMRMWPSSEVLSANDPSATMANHTKYNYRSY